MKLTVGFKSLHPGLKAAGLVDSAPGHGLAAHDIFT